MTSLEREVQRGLDVIKAHNPKRWELVSTLADVNLPSDRPRTDHPRRAGARDPLRSSQPRRWSSHAQPGRGTALLLHRHGRSGRIRPVTVEPTPESLEAVLAERGIHKQNRSGVERLMPAMFAYDLPPTRRATTDVTPASPVRVPMVSSWLSETRNRPRGHVLPGDIS